MKHAVNISSRRLIRNGKRRELWALSCPCGFGAHDIQTEEEAEDIASEHLNHRSIHAAR